MSMQFTISPPNSVTKSNSSKTTDHAGFISKPRPNNLLSTKFDAKLMAIKFDSKKHEQIIYTGIGPIKINPKHIEQIVYTSVVGQLITA